MEEFSFVCEVTYLDLNGEKQTEYGGISHRNTFSEIVKEIEDYYKEDLLSIKMTILSNVDENPPFLTLSKEVYEDFLQNC